MRPGFARPSSSWDGLPTSTLSWSRPFASAGHEIGSHGHHHLRAYDLTPDAFAADLRRSVSALNAVGVPRVTSFRAPEWSINERSLWALGALAQEGFEVDASMAPVRLVGSPAFPRHPHVRQTASGSITEVPPLVADRFGQVMPIGWGWGLRMSSPGRVLRSIEEMNRIRSSRRARCSSLGV